MKRLLCLLFCLSACDSTKDWLDALNEAPQLNFTNNSKEPVFIDSIKMSLKVNQKSYPIKLRVTDKNNNIKEIRYTQLAGKGTLKQNQIDIIENNIEFKRDSAVLEFAYYPEILGEHSLALTATDEFGLSNTVTLRVIAFENLLPVAVFDFGKLGVLSPNEYFIRARDSYDQDARFGGIVEEYEFSVLGKIYSILAVNGNQIKVIFPADPEKKPVIYPISVRVRDNDGKWSSPVEKTVTIN